MKPTYLNELIIARNLWIDLKHNSTTGLRSTCDLEIQSIDQEIQLVVKDEELIRLSPDDTMLFGIANVITRNYN